ncbi:MAG: RodZ domain-containing protein, partial [Thermodesulfobacteriota bacterium]
MSESGFAALGRRLREKREELGFSLREVSEKTRVPLHVLENIEAGDATGLPAPVFVKGFLRSYAIEIGLSPEEVIQEYKFHNPEADTGVAVPITARKGAHQGYGPGFWLGTIFLLLLGLIALAVYYYPDWKDWGPFGELFSEAQQTIEGQLSPQPPQPVAEAVQPEPASPPQPQPEPQPQPQPEPAPAPAPPPAEEPPAAEPPAETHELTMVFDQVSWVQVVIDNDKMQHGLFGPGTTKTWKAKEGFFLRIGNAGGVK